jgi:hypothetical protein
MMQILCTHVCKWKNETCWNCSRNGVRGNKGQWFRVWIQLWCIVTTFINVTMYSQNNNKKILKRVKWNENWGLENNIIKWHLKCLQELYIKKSSKPHHNLWLQMCFLTLQASSWQKASLVLALWLNKELFYE